MYVCLFSIQNQTAGKIAMKFGTEVVLKGGKVLGGFWLGTPDPVGMGCIKGVWVPLEPQPCILAKLYKTKVAGHPHFSLSVLYRNPNHQMDGNEIWGHIFRPKIWIQKDLGPMSFCSHVHSYSKM